MILLLLLLIAAPAAAVPVVPNFSQGVLSSTTTTKTKVSEVINSYEYRTGYEYSVSGTNIQPDASIAPMGLSHTTNTLDGVTSKWTTLDATTKPSWTIVNHKEAMQFVETLRSRSGKSHDHQQRHGHRIYNRNDKHLHSMKRVIATLLLLTAPAQAQVSSTAAPG